MGWPVGTEVVLGCGEPDQHLGLDLRGDDGGVVDARDVEPHVVEPDALARSSSPGQTTHTERA